MNLELQYLGIYSLKNNLNFSHSQAYSTLLGWPIFYLLYLWLLSLYPDIRDFYDDNDQFTVTNKERNAYNSFLEGLEDWEREVLDRAVSEDLNYYILENLHESWSGIFLDQLFFLGESNFNVPT